MMHKKQGQEKADYSKAKALYMQKEKEEMVERVEFYANRPTIYLYYTEEVGSRYQEDFREYFRGVPVMENGKLQGFNMILRFDRRDEKGNMKRGEFAPYLDKNGDQIYMTVDEFYNFYRELKEIDQTVSGRQTMKNEEEQIEQIRLNYSKLAKLRRRIFKGIDSLVKNVGMEKIGGNTGFSNLENTKVVNSLKKVEKAVSDTLFGRVKE